MDDEINLLDYWRVIVKRWKLIICLMIIAVLTTWVYSSVYNARQPELYKASVSIMLTDAGGGGLGSALAAVSFLGGKSGGGGESKLFPILKSATLAKQVAQSLDLAVFFPNFSPELSREKKVRSAAAKLRGAVEAKSSEGLLYVSIVWTNPKQAATLANSYVRNLGKFLSSRSLSVNFQVIDPAVAPIAPFNKRGAKKNMLIGAGVGLFSGIFLAFLFDYFKKISEHPS